MKKTICAILFLFLVSPSVIFAMADYAKKNNTNSGSPMVLISSGDFIMGSGPGKKRVFVKNFHIDKHEISNAQYRVFLDWVKKNSDKTVRHPDQPVPKDHTPRFWKPFIPRLLKKKKIEGLRQFDEKTFLKDDHPVVGVDWHDAYAYAKWAGKRLPTEAEWEKAARGINGALWPWGDKWVFKHCNSGGYEWKGERDGHIYSAPVNAYPEGASPYGVYNMAGNVAEWVDGAFDSAGLKKIIKGGGSNSYPSSVMPSTKKGDAPEYRHFALGFRCARNAD